MSYFKLEQKDGVAHVVMDDPGQPVNVLNDGFIVGLEEILSRLESERESISGVVLSSCKETFFAGADLHKMLALTPADARAWFEKVTRVKSLQRRIERLGMPVVAAISGAALGAGYELCLVCHHRIALADSAVRVGLPEVTLGLMPGGGGVVRLVRLLGLKRALPLLLEGSTLDSQTALATGLIDEVVSDRHALLERATEVARQGEPKLQRWDRPDYKYPGGGLDSRALRTLVTLATADLQAKKRNLYPAPQAILSTAVESMRVDVDTADRIESRYFVGLANSAVAKNMMTTFFQTRAIKRGSSRPPAEPASRLTQIGVVGAGMMGSGIAWAAAAVGINVLLTDVTDERAQKGKVYSWGVADKLIAQGRMTTEQRDALVARIHPATNRADFSSCQIIVEAVFEDRELKAAVTRDISARIGRDAIFASNTSTLPITGLASAAVSPERFIGLHFFSPVDRMPLIEIICGKKTSDATLAQAYDFVRQLGKTPIVVNDSPGFFTSRVYESFCDEGAWLLSDGVEPALIDNLAQHVGMPAGPLAAVDAVSQQLLFAVKASAIKDAQAAGKPYAGQNEPPYLWIRRMVEEFGRLGKAHGAGYFDYPKGAGKRVWPQLRALQPQNATAVPERDIKDRILYRQSIEAVRCLQEGVLRTAADGNIGSMLGIGFPSWTGGQLQYINSCGVTAFVARARELADRYGKRFTPSSLLIEMAESGGKFV